MVNKLKAKISLSLVPEKYKNGMYKENLRFLISEDYERRRKNEQRVINLSLLIKDKCRDRVSVG